LPLPGLAPATTTAVDWTLRVSSGAPPAHDETTIGVEAMDVGSVTLSQIPGGFRLRYEDTGCFDVLDGGADIVWYDEPHADPELVRIDVCGRVLATALHASGALCLHASAVATRAGAVAFVAPKAHGKSTLAAALLRRDVALLTDDTLPVIPVRPPVARPGVHQIRLNADSADALLDPTRHRREARGGKVVVHGTDGLARQETPVPLAAIYELAPTRELPDGAAAARAVVPARLAAIALLRHARPAALLGGPEAAAVLARAATVASCVPVYRLDVAAGLDRIDEVATLILGWHSEGVA
jgi:hypothetical protein